MSNQDFKAKFKSGAEVLSNLFADQKGPVADQFLRWKLWMNWSDIVGQTTAESCEPISYHQGVLTLWVKNSTWLTQMNFMSEAIKNSINQKFSQNMVKDIRLTLDRKSVPYTHDEQFKEQLRKFFKK